MIPPPALGGALMDAHDRIETAGAMTPEWMQAVHDSILAEWHLVAITGWSQERVNQRGCQLWGELRGDDRFDDPFSGMETCPSCRRAIGSAEVHQCPGDRFAEVAS